jgi:hypothetical protein
LFNQGQMMERAIHIENKCSSARPCKLWTMV